MKVMVTTEPDSTLQEDARMTTIVTSGSLLANRADAAAPTRQPSFRQLTRSVVMALHRLRCASVTLVAVVVVADVDPLRPIWRPHPAPAAIVAGVKEGRANERKAMEAVTAKVVAISEREP